MNAVLEAQDLDCVRGGSLLFSGLGVAVRPGQLLRVLGANGAGKTSLLRMICGLLAPARGEVRWRGQKIAALREEYSRQLVYLGHSAALKDDLSAIENLQASGVLAGLAPTQGEAAAALAEAGLKGRELQPVRTLSQGQRRRVGLARLVLSGGAGLWVLDEPFNALDTGATEWLLRLVTAQLQRGGVVVLTSHQSVALGDGLPQLAVSL